MRARNLKPSIFKNEHLAKLGPDHFRAFTGLWCLADRKGRLEDRPERIEAELFPFKFQVVNMEKIMVDLSEGEEPFIIRYVVNDKRYVQIANFEKHQHPHPRESESTYPGMSKAIPRHGRARLIPPSPFLDSLLPIPPSGDSENKPVEKPLTDIQKVITVYKLSCGFERDDKKWDRAFFGRYSRVAKDIIEFMGSWKDAADCVQDTVEKIRHWNPEATISLDTILGKHAAEWKKTKLEKEAHNGILPLQGNGGV